VVVIVKRRRRGVFRERILRVLLSRPDGMLTKYRLAKSAECSFSWVHEFLRKLEALKLVESTRVVDYAGFVRFWLSVKTVSERKDYMHREPLELLRETSLQYALTTYEAESLVQHYLFPSRLDLYVRPEDGDQWHRLISSEGLVGKGNLRLLLADSHVFFGSFKRQNLTVVSVPQLIVDLFEEGGVCTEAAEKLLEKMKEHAIHAK
jgi:hypothetical protein